MLESLFRAGVEGQVGFEVVKSDVVAMGVVAGGLEGEMDVLAGEPVDEFGDDLAGVSGRGFGRGSVDAPEDVLGGVPEDAAASGTLNFGRSADAPVVIVEPAGPVELVEQVVVAGQAGHVVGSGVLGVLGVSDVLDEPDVLGVPGVPDGFAA